MKGFIDKTKRAIASGLSDIRREVDASMKLVIEKVEGLPFYASLQHIETETVQYDEKHYFVIPFYLSEHGFSLHTMRVLPNDVPEVNDLPKRRVFHFPNEHYEGLG